MPAVQNIKLTFVQGRVGVRLSLCLSPALSQNANRHSLQQPCHFIWFHSLKSYYKKIGLKLSWGISGCAWSCKCRASSQCIWLNATLLGCSIVVPQWLETLLPALSLRTHLSSQVRVFMGNINSYVARGHFFWKKLIKCLTTTVILPNCPGNSCYLKFFSHLFKSQHEESCTTFQKSPTFSTLTFINQGA